MPNQRQRRLRVDSDGVARPLEASLGSNQFLLFLGTHRGLAIFFHLFFFFFFFEPFLAQPLTSSLLVAPKTFFFFLAWALRAKRVPTLCIYDWMKLKGRDNGYFFFFTSCCARSHHLHCLVYFFFHTFSLCFFMRCDIDCGNTFFVVLHSIVIPPGPLMPMLFSIRMRNYFIMTTLYSYMHHLLVKLFFYAL
jgi:hypothetical protein